LIASLELVSRRFSAACRVIVEDPQCASALSDNGFLDAFVTLMQESERLARELVTVQATAQQHETPVSRSRATH
jgi:hypothetical protein